MSSSPCSKAQAKQLISDINADRGLVNNATLETLKRRGLKDAEYAARAVRARAGRSVKTWLEKLDTDATRCVYEMLRNADRNHRSATEDTTISRPRVRFCLHADRLSIESTEDPLTEDQLRSICDMEPRSEGQESATQPLAGYSGLGFRTAFTVSREVRVYSGHLCFSLEHQGSDDGSGMICPVWRNQPEVRESGPLTHIHMFLHNWDHAAGKSRSSRAAVLSQVQEIPATVLLFLNKVEQIDIEIYDGDRLELHRSLSRVVSDGGRRIALTTTAREHQQKPMVTREIFYTTRYVATERQEAEGHIEAAPTNELMLAFQLDEASKPVPRHHDAFSFAPLEPMGFNFIVRGDWVTGPTGRDIIQSSPQNARLADMAADAFVQAVQELSINDRDPLRYRWMGFLPKQRVHRTRNYLLKRYAVCIGNLLRTTPVMIPFGEPGERKVLRRVNDIRPLWNRLRDGERGPLVVDTTIWTATGYQSHGLGRLRGYGLESMPHLELLGSIKRDLSGCNSVMKAPTTSFDWHSGIARMLCNWYLEGREADTEELRRLKLVPLCDGSWVAATDGDIYFPQTAGAPIPRDLPHLRLVHPAAARNADRRRLFGLLGASWLSVATVRRAIIERYQQPEEIIRETITVTASRQHLIFLYLTQHCSNEDTGGWFDEGRLLFEEEELDGKEMGGEPYTEGGDDMVEDDAAQFSDDGSDDDGIDDGDDQSRIMCKLHEIVWLFDQFGSMVAPGTAVYDPTANHQHSPRRLMGTKACTFLSRQYFENPPGTPHCGTGSWPKWLSARLGIRRRIPLVTAGMLSPECLLVAQRRPDMLLPFLGYTWGMDRHLLLAEEEALSSLKGLEVLCDGDRTWPLARTYLPSSRSTPRMGQAASTLREACLTFLNLDGGDFFPFPKLSVNAPDLSEIWADLGLMKEDDIHFRLEILRCMKEAYSDPCRLRKPHMILELYAHIHDMCASAGRGRRGRPSKASTAAFLLCEDFFRSGDYVLIPGQGLKPATWAGLRDCFWNAPDKAAEIAGWHRLEAHYSELWSGRGREALKHLHFESVRNLFRQTLDVADMEWTHVTDELRRMALDTDSDDYVDSERIRRLYELLQAMPKSTGGRMRSTFEQGRLIYSQGTQRWQAPSQCAWVTGEPPDDVNGKVRIDHIYEAHLRDFFVQELGVQLLDRDIEGSTIHVSSPAPSTPFRCVRRRPSTDSSSTTATGSGQSTVEDHETPPTDLDDPLEDSDDEVEDESVEKKLYRWVAKRAKAIAQAHLDFEAENTASSGPPPEDAQEASSEKVEHTDRHSVRRKKKAKKPAMVVDILKKSDSNQIIGSAGELLVYEALNSLGLPNFSEACWQTAGRSRVVGALKRYRHWGKAEATRSPADILYYDENGELTRRLVARGKMDETRVSSQLQYKIEVKTSTQATRGGRDRISLTARQGEMMDANTDDGTPGKRLEVVNVIFLVSNLGNEDMRLAVHVDPSLRVRNGDWIYLGSSWSVGSDSDKSSTSRRPSPGTPKSPTPSSRLRPNSTPPRLTLSSLGERPAAV